MVFELLLLLLLAQGVGSLVADKGYPRLPYQALLFGLTLLLQGLGAFLCMFLLEGRSGRSVLGEGVDVCFGYLGGTVGAVVGMGVTFLVVLNLGDNEAADLPGHDLPADATARFAARRRARGANRRGPAPGSTAIALLLEPTPPPPRPGGTDARFKG